MKTFEDKPLWKGFFSVFKALPEMSVADWAEYRRVLPSESSSMPGPWRNERTPYLVEIMKELSPTSRTKEVAICKGHQVGATEAAINWLLCSVDLQPGPFLILQPTIKTAKKFSKQRLTPSIDLCKYVKGKIGGGKKAGNSLEEKAFPGGYVFIGGANSPADLASMPMGNIIADEIDRYPQSAGKEGDPIKIVSQRSSNFPRAKKFFLSTPTLKAISHIWKLFCDSDRRYYHLPCPHCCGIEGQPNGGYFVLEFELLHWDRGKPETVMCYCPHCGTGIEEYHKTEMLKNGKWVAENPGHERAGFHISSLYSPLGWKSWKEIVKDFEDAGNDVEARKVFMNTNLGLPWDNAGEQIAEEYLDRRKEQYACQVPPGVLILTMAVDVQKDRLEYLVMGWGKGEESWAIETGAIYGDTSVMISKGNVPDHWKNLDLIRTKGFYRIDGTEMRIGCTMVDAGYRSDVVYEYTKARERMKVFAVRGSSTPNKPIANKPSRNTKNRAAMFYVGTDQAKELIYSRLKIEDAGPGYYHFPNDEKTGFNASFYAGLISEKKIEVFKRGFKRLEWHKDNHARNEPLDLAVYNLAAIRFMEKDLARLTIQYESIKTPTNPITPEAKPTQRHFKIAPKQNGITLNQ